MSRTEDLMEMMEFMKKTSIRNERERIIKEISRNEPLRWEIGEKGYNELIRIINDENKSL